ncbi:MAG: ABC transporter transmembrane domain-containing protein, partial [Bacteroidales bacterium]
MEKFIRLLSFAKPHSSYWAKYLPCTILAMVFGIANFMLIIPLLNIIFDSSNVEVINTLPPFSPSAEFIKQFFGYYLYSIKVNHGVMWALSFICLSIVIASLFANTFKYFSSMILGDMNLRVLENIRNAIYEKINTLHIGFFSNQRKGNLLSIMSNDIAEVQSSTVFSFQIIFREPILIIGNLAVLFYMSYQLTLITLIAFPISAYFVSLATKKLRKKAVVTQQLQGDIMSIIEETISGARIIKAFNAQHYVKRAFLHINRMHRNASFKVAIRSNIAPHLSEFLGITIAMIILFFGGMMIIQGNSNLSIPEFITYLAFYYQILTPVKEISKGLAAIQRGMASADRIFAVLDTPVNIKKTKNPIDLIKFEQQIEFKDVDFCYDKEPILQNINLTIPKGKMYALVGA